MASLTPDEKDVLEANQRFYESLSAGSIDGIQPRTPIIRMSPRCLKRARRSRSAGRLCSELEGCAIRPLCGIVRPRNGSPAIKVHGSIARVAGLRESQGKDERRFAHRFHCARYKRLRKARRQMAHGSSCAAKLPSILFELDAASNFVLRIDRRVRDRGWASNAARG